MTREEKISHLKDILSEINENDDAVCYLTSEDNELIESAIEALEQQPCKDAISRADALKALDYDIKSFEFKSGVGRHMNEIANLLNTIYDIQSDNIKALPSVQPKIKTGHWIESDNGNMISWHRWYCSECGGMHHDTETGEWREEFDFRYAYCPLCGAEMIEPQESEE